MAAGSESKVPIGPPSLPFPVFRLSSSRKKYMLYDIDTVTWLRQTHHILGVQIGGMPQFPQQNVFFGLPLELMPEEARLLVEKSLAYVVDDLEAHNKVIEGVNRGDVGTRNAIRGYNDELAQMASQSEEQAALVRAEAEEAAKSRNRRPEKKEEPAIWNAAKLPWIGSDPLIEDTDATLFAGEATQPTKKQASKEPWSITPATASSLISNPAGAAYQEVDVSAAKYSMFKHLHDKGYYMSPGLRFGCQLMAYPGDPLRFHSHFLCAGADWDEELDLLDIIGGGRLGTGVKKGYLLGGVQADGERAGDVRTFCIEWGGL